MPFGITVDAQTLNDRTVTLRERDSTSQVHTELAACMLMLHLLSRLTSWSLADVQTACMLGAPHFIAFILLLK